MKVSYDLTIPRVVMQHLLTLHPHYASQYLAQVTPHDLPPPDPWNDLIPSLTDFLFRIARTKQPLAIWGDHDADGIVSTSLLNLSLRIIGVQPSVYIPNRLQHRHGLHQGVVEWLEQLRAKTLIVCDCASDDGELIQDIRRRGIKVIHIDHHASSVLPDVDWQLHTLALPERSAYYAMPSSGIAFFVARALSPDLAERWAALSSIGLIADVPQWEPYAWQLARLGLVAARHKMSSHIVTLSETMRVPIADIGSQIVGYYLAPCLNAAAKLGAHEVALDYFLAQTRDDIARLSGFNGATLF